MCKEEGEECQRSKMDEFTCVSEETIREETRRRGKERGVAVARN
jgi:hypothetical protein